ncbi:MAG: hypothetical protein PHU75_06840 [Candidatus Nanopelagicales bacterium]|nr:hypothetical protein [Candidatus Nanopelagicales bacterium]
MRRLLRAACAVFVVVFTGAGVLATSAVARAMADPVKLDGVSSTARVPMTPDAFWYSQVTRDGLCQLLTGCVSASGAGTDWIYRMKVPVPGMGVQTVDMKAQVVEQVLLEKVRMSLSYDNVLGSIKGDVTVSLKPSGQSTDVTVAFEDMSANGVAATALPVLQARLAPDLQSGLVVVSRKNARAGTKVQLTITPGSRATARVKVTGSTLTIVPPKAAGQMRVIAGRKVLCTAPVKAGAGQCRFKPPAKGVPVQAVVTGKFSNGYAFAGSATKRYGR